MTNKIPLGLKLARALRLARKVRGGQRVIRTLVPLRAGTDAVFRNKGLNLNCRLDDGIEWQLAALGGYEEDEKTCFLKLFPADRRNLLLDVGANIGSHSLTFATRFKRVWAFEPNPHVFSRLTANLALNEQLPVEPYNIGLADVESHLTFYQPTADSMRHGLGTFDASYAPQSSHKIDLPVRRGDDFVAEQGNVRIDGIKIDVQGFGPMVLRGLSETIRRDRPAIWFEVSEATIRVMQQSGGLNSFFPENYRLLRFIGRRALGLFHSVAIEAVDDRQLEPGDYVVTPGEWGTR